MHIILCITFSAALQRCNWPWLIIHTMFSSLHVQLHVKSFSHGNQTTLVWNQLRRYQILWCSHLPKGGKQFDSKGLYAVNVRAP